ncbi:hypothetical protein CWI84_00220 [Idiomarina tyrosinivorans]|uniref:DUF4282 domain-containing protein n=1 Tax=Idiomarina tyrosinivorans TaxID=1445662 RepID=A0A432ZTI9_9GAMM|nr:DUF4282 domain-containing protein [Idiomarina tyrosinivorans]RUO81230.1 hypothetical protein CWI84_00220 [Idiomarina tyrosinivorans]
MRNFFFFDTMIVPKIITVVYWLIMLAVVVAGVGQMFAYQGSVIMGLVYIILGIVGARIWCEMVIVIFKIHENLKRIADRNGAE